MAISSSILVIIYFISGILYSVFRGVWKVYKISILLLCKSLFLLDLLLFHLFHGIGREISISCSTLLHAEIFRDLKNIFPVLG